MKPTPTPFAIFAVIAFVAAVLHAAEGDQEWISYAALTVFCVAVEVWVWAHPGD